MKDKRKKSEEQKKSLQSETSMNKQNRHA